MKAPSSSSSKSSALLTLLAGLLFWPAAYRVFAKIVAFVTEVTKESPALEISSFLLLSLLPICLLHMKMSKWTIDVPLKKLGGATRSPGLRHVVLALAPALRSLTNGLLMYFAVNLFVSAIPEKAEIHLPEKFKHLDPSGDGILTGPEIEGLVHEVTRRALVALLYLEVLVVGLGVLKKPAEHKPVGADIVDKYWKRLDKRKPKTVLFCMGAHIFLLLVCVSGMMQALGLSPRAILALSSVGGLAFGLAAKNVIGNLISGLLLMVDNPIAVDDVILVQGEKGAVRSMGWMFVELQRGDETVVLPNASVINSKTIHYGPLTDALNKELAAPKEP